MLQLHSQSLPAEYLVFDHRESDLKDPEKLEKRDEGGGGGY